MVSPVQFNNSQRVYFRANEDLINAPGAFEQPTVPETQEDEVVLSTQTDAKEKSSVGKTIAKVAGGVLVAAAALFGAYKWKGDTWLNKEATGTTAKIKNWLMKPGEYMEKGFKRIKNALGFGKDAKGTSKAEGETPKAEGGTSKAEGETPKAEGETPKAEGETPKAEGEVPEK